jgi:ABC-2 type transport system permease protein
MIKLLHIAREEMGYHLRQWTFYLSAIGMPLVFAAIGAFPRLQTVAAETPLASVETILTETDEITAPTGYVDQAGLITTIPADQTDMVQAFFDEGQAEAALEQGEIESYYVIADDYIHSGRVVQYSNNPQLLADGDAIIRQLLRGALLHTLDDPDRAARLMQPVALTRRGPPPSAVSFFPADLDMSRLISAGLLAGLFAYVISLGGNLLLRALHREVRARVLEMMVVSATPEQFIGGKLLGLTTLVLGQAGLALLAGLFVYGQNPDGSGPSALPLVTVALSFPFLLLGFLGYCGTIMSIAALWPTFRESGSLLTVMRLLVLSPLIGALFILPQANGLTAVSLTLLPLTSPLLMPFRLLITEVPLWQRGLGLSILAAWTTFLIWLSMRLFRVYSILTGRPINPKTLWLALRTG